MNTELISIETDTAPLDGAYYEPTSGTKRGAVMLMHGNVGNFYSGPSRFLAPRLVDMGYTCLAFNRRGHDILVNQSGRGVTGGAFQSAAQGMADNEFAAAFMAERGHSSPVVIGHSNGGMLASCFANGNAEITALILLSAHAGGADTYPRSCAAGLMADGQTDEFETTARTMVAEGRGGELLLLPKWWYAVTADSLVDRIDNTPDTLTNAATVRCPVLAIRGSLESAVTYPMEEFARLVPGPSRAVVVEGSNHFYSGCERHVTDLVATWLGELGQQ